jgi:hypothetical protein
MMVRNRTTVLHDLVTGSVLDFGVETDGILVTPVR